MTETLIIFSRYPEAGKTKTRMIPALGEKGAAKLQREMTEHTINSVRQLKRSRNNLSIEVHFNGGDRQLMENWLGQNIDYYPQVAGNLGQKMCSAFDRAFEIGNNRVVTIGIDCPELNQTILTEAFEVLKSTDLVLGETQDGGYYLIGLSNYASEPTINLRWKQLFNNIDWGTDRVFKQTIDIAKNLNLNTHYLSVLRDVDRPEDLVVWRST